MPLLKLFAATALIIVTINSCCLKCPVTQNGVMHLAKGADILLGEYSKIVINGNTCLHVGERVVKTTITTIPAVELTPDHQEIKGDVSISTGIGNTHNYIETLWGADEVNFTYYGHCMPKPDYYPYPAGPYGNQSFYTIFVPAKSFRSSLPEPYFDALTQMAITVNDITKINCYWLCSPNDVVATNQKYKDFYSDTACCLGVMARLTLKNKQHVDCYVINTGLAKPPGKPITNVYPFGWKNFNR